MTWKVASAQRNCIGETVCGDGCHIHELDGVLTVTVTDGLGHGPGAAAASEAFIEFLKTHPTKSLGDLMAEGSAAITSTRGAAVSIMRFDATRSVFTYCGVGNCHIHSVVSGSPILPVSSPGIVGHRIRKVVTQDFPLPESGLFVLCSDGMPSRLDITGYEDASVEDIANDLLQKHGRGHDDVTVAVVRISVD